MDRFEGQVAERLAGYEDTGLTPDEVAMLKNHVELLERERQECSECEAVDNLKARLWDVTHKDWIPVLEQPPEYDGQYLVCFDDGFVATAAYKTDSNGTQDWELWADSGIVVAWMPLPGPYKEG